MAFSLGRLYLHYTPVEHEHAARAGDGDSEIPPGQFSQVLLLEPGHVIVVAVAAAAVSDPRDVAAAAAASARRHQ